MILVRLDAIPEQFHLFLRDPSERNLRTQLPVSLLHKLFDFLPYTENNL